MALDAGADDYLRKPFGVGELTRLTPTEYRLLTALIRHAGKVLTHRQLLKEAWGAAYQAETQYLRVYMGPAPPQARAGPCAAALPRDGAWRRLPVADRVAGRRLTG